MKSARAAGRPAPQIWPTDRPAGSKQRRKAETHRARHWRRSRVVVVVV